MMDGDDFSGPDRAPVVVSDDELRLVWDSVGNISGKVTGRDSSEDSDGGYLLATIGRATHIVRCATIVGGDRTTNLVAFAGDAAVAIVPSGQSWELIALPVIEAVRWIESQLKLVGDDQPQMVVVMTRYSLDESTRSADLGQPDEAIASLVADGVAHEAAQVFVGSWRSRLRTGSVTCFSARDSASEGPLVGTSSMVARSFTWFEDGGHSIWLLPGSIEEGAPTEAVRASAAGFGSAVTALMALAGWSEWASLEIDSMKL